MTKVTHPRALVDRLREDVFYGEERMHKMHKHNPLHLDAADALTAALDEIERLRVVLSSTTKALDEITSDGWLGEIDHKLVRQTLFEARAALKGSDQ